MNGPVLWGQVRCSMPAQGNMEAAQENARAFANAVFDRLILKEAAA